MNLEQIKKKSLSCKKVIIGIFNTSMLKKQKQKANTQTKNLDHPKEPRLDGCGQVRTDGQTDKDTGEGHEPSQLSESQTTVMPC